MAHSSFGPGWPNCSRSQIVTLVRNDGLRLPVHQDIAGLVAILLDLTELSGYDVKPGQTWGYACRAIAGTSTPSNHSWGTAVDINAPSNPRRARGLPRITDIPKKVVALWKNHGFRWGGDYSWPDAMHMEFMGTAADAQRIERRLRAYLGSATPTVPHIPDRKPPAADFPGTVRMGDTGVKVRAWQRALNAAGYRIDVDGVFGPATNHVVRDWQAKHALTIDGVAGSRTWTSLTR
jgi:hypothetical protein